jgi:putative ABC transport system permease protein
VSVPTVDCIHVAGRCPHLDAQAAFGFPSVAVGGPELLRTLIQRVDPAAERALNAGRPIIFARSGVGAPTQLGYGSGYRPPPGLAARYVVGVGERGAAVPALISPATAAALDARTSMVLQIAVTAGQPSSAEIDLANGQLPTSSSLVLDTGYHSRYDVGVIVLAIAAAIVMLAATAVSVGLSMAESKPDLVTLAAVGSRPSTRRLLVASQAGTVSLLGATQGVVAGLIPAWAVLHALRRPGFTLPWMSMLVIVVGIPLLAMAVAAAFAGTRLTLTRRLT